MAADTLAMLRAAGEQARRIDAMLDNLSARRRDLAAVNEHVGAGQIWKPRFYYGPDVYVELPVPGPYLQQWAIDQVRRAERAVVQEGVVVPPDPFRKKRA